MSFDDSNADAASSEDSRTDLPALVASLIYSLRARGLTADTRQAVAVEELLKSLPWQDPEFDLAAHLGPIFCRSQDEQRRFRGIVSELPIVAGHAASTVQRDTVSTVTEEDTPVRRYSIYAMFFAVLLFVTTAAFFTNRTKPPIERVDPEPTPTGKDGGGGGEKTNVDPSPAVNFYSDLLAYQRILLQRPLANYSNWSWICSTIPLLVLLGIWGYRGKKAHLVRQRTEVPPIFREVRLPGGPREPFARLRVRDLSRSLRIRQRVASRELDIDATITRTLANGGRPTLVFESFTEPRYLVLIDRAGADDHFGRLSEALFHTLQNGNVDCDAFEFEGSPIYCNLPANRRRPSGRFRFRLTEILDSLPDRPLLILSDGAGFLSQFTDSPPEWFSWVNDRQRVLVTPASDRVDWTDREQKLRRHGFHVVPMTPEGMPEVATVLQGLESPRRLPRRFSLPFESETERCLSLFEPPAEFKRTLCRQLKEHLQEDGYLWLASLAAYPEIHWGLTLRFGAALIQDDERWELLLPRLSRLVWLRHGYMPDWFREALLALLSPKDQTEIRQLLMQFLSIGQSVGGTNDKTADPTDIPLKIAMETPSGLWKRMKAWLTSHRQIKDEGRQHLDHVYLRFLSGRGPQWLAPFVPAPLLKLLFPQGAWVQGPRIWLVAAGCLALSFATFAGIEWYRERIFQVTSIEVSRDGSLIVTRQRDGQTRLWKHLTPLLELRGHTGPVWSAKFNQDGTLVASTSEDKTARVWDVASGKLLQTCTHDDPVRTVNFSPDGTRIITTCTNTARVWDVATGQLGLSFQHQGYVNAALFSPDGTNIVTTSSDQTAVIWDSATGKSKVELKQDSIVWSASFSSDGRHLVTGCWGKKNAHVWDVRTGAALFAPLEHDGDVMDVGFNASNTRILTSCGYDSHSEPLYAQLWSASNGSPIGPRMRHDGNVFVATFSPNEKWVITGSEDGTARLWDAATGLPISSPLIHENWVRRASFNKDSTLALTCDDQSARVWDVSTGNLLLLLRRTEKANDASFSPDGTKVLTAGEDGIVRIWDCRRDQYDFGAPHENPCIAMSTDGYRWAEQGPNGDVLIYERGQPDPVFRLPASEKGSVYLLPGKQSAYKTTLIVGHAGKIALHGWGDGQESGTIDVAIKEPIGGRWGASENLIFWDSSGMACIHTPTEIPKIPIAINPVGYAQSEDRLYLALWGTTRGATVIETQTGLFGTIDSTQRLRGVVFHPSSSQLFAWDDSGKGDLIDFDFNAVKPGEMNLKSRQFHGSQLIRAAGFSRAGQVLHIHTQHGELSFHSIEPQSDPGQKMFATLRSPIKNVRQVLWGDQENMAVVFNDGTVRLWDGMAGVAISDPLPTSGKVKLAAFGATAPSDSTPMTETAMFSVAPQDKAETKSDREPILDRFDGAANAPKLPAAQPVNNANQGNRPQAQDQPPQNQPPENREITPPKPVPPPPPPPPIRQALAMVTEKGNLEVFDVNNSGRGVALIISTTEAHGITSREIEPLRQTLAMRFGFKVTVLDHPTKMKVQQEWNGLQASVTPQDRFLMILTGTGMATGGHYSFMLADKLWESISLSEIRDFMNSIRADQSLLIADTSYSELLMLDPPDSGSTRRCPQVIAAAGPQEQTWILPDRQKLLTPLRQLLEGKAPLAAPHGSMTRLDGPIDSQTLFDSLAPLVSKASDSPDIRKSGQFYSTKKIFMGPLVKTQNSSSSRFYFPEPKYVLPRDEDKAANETSRIDVDNNSTKDLKKDDIKPEDAKAADAKPEDVKPVDSKAE